MNTVFAFYSATNWSNMGTYRSTPSNRMPIPKDKPAGRAVAVLPNGKRVAIRTKSDRTAARKMTAFLMKPVVKEVPVETTWKFRFIKKSLTLNGKSVTRKVCKLTGSNGVVKFFVTKKAATAWVAAQ